MNSEKQGQVWVNDQYQIMTLCLQMNNLKQPLFYNGILFWASDSLTALLFWKLKSWNSEFSLFFLLAFIFLVDNKKVRSLVDAKYLKRKREIRREKQKTSNSLKSQTFLFESHFFLFHNNYDKKTMTKTKSIKSVFFHFSKKGKEIRLHFISSHFTMKKNKILNLKMIINNLNKDLNL